MSLATAVRDVSRRAGRARPAMHEIGGMRARLARSAGPVVRETGKFVLTLAVLAVIMAGLAALDIAIWLPPFR